MNATRDQHPSAGSTPPEDIRDNVADFFIARSWDIAGSDDAIGLLAVYRESLRAANPHSPGMPFPDIGIARLVNKLTPHMAVELTACGVPNGCRAPLPGRLSP